MFAPPNPVQPRRSASLGISLLLHLLFIAWLVHRASPQLLSPSSVMYGKQGSVIAQLYWPSHPTADGSEAASAAAHLTWQAAQERKKHKHEATVAKVEPDLPVAAKTETNQTIPAGSPYGSAWTGSATGDEVRPALPISASDPVVTSSDLADVIEGDVVIEITIDDRGEIVQKVVLKTLGPAIDAKVLAALESWHFRPATRNGVAIPSKQDVLYHFKPRNG